MQWSYLKLNLCSLVLRIHVPNWCKIGSFASAQRPQKCFHSWSFQTTGIQVAQWTPNIFFSEFPLKTKKKKYWPSNLEGIFCDDMKKALGFKDNIPQYSIHDGVATHDDEIQEIRRFCVHFLYSPGAIAARVVGLRGGRLCPHIALQYHCSTSNLDSPACLIISQVVLLDSDLL